ncbi:MAG: hypothetical protein EBS90_10020 [Betaproteobacteria bacterium]|nr:hypothetical protein [Betaproteobacteria bacterium]
MNTFIEEISFLIGIAERKIEHYKLDKSKAMCEYVAIVGDGSAPLTDERRDQIKFWVGKFERAERNLWKCKRHLRFLEAQLAS